jgi:hypothetical protein
MKANDSHRSAGTCKRKSGRFLDLFKLHLACSASPPGRLDCTPAPTYHKLPAETSIPR